MAELTLEAFEAGILRLASLLEPTDEIYDVPFGSRGGNYAQNGLTEEVVLPAGAGANAVLECIPLTGSPSVSFQVMSGSKAGQLINIADVNGLQTITTAKQIPLSTLLKYVALNITAITGTWRFVLNFHRVAIAGSASGGSSPHVVGAQLITPNAATTVDRSGTIATGGTAQNAAAANTSRQYLQLLNPASATESLWASITGTAAVNGESSGSYELKPGESMAWYGPAVPSNALSVIAATTGHKFTCTEI